jgi:hypothetical protein
MLRFAKAFWDIALWRRSPAQLPASLFLLGLLAAVVALLEVIGAMLPPSSSDRIVMRVVLSVGLPLGFAWVVLAIARHGQRFLQTGTALLGVGILAELVVYPVSSLLDLVGTDQPIAIPLGVMLLMGFIWYLLACANIWRAALDSGAGLGIAVSVGYMVLSTVLEQQLLPGAS